MRPRRGTPGLSAAVRRWLAGSAGAVTIALALTASPGEAHKPITSPFTFNEDVFPILRDRCGSCHVAGGVAPMSLMTHGETVPWGESLRLELIAGHMPPWAATTSAGRFRQPPALSARELNTLLTWASGGTPPGDESKPPPPVTLGRAWRLGAPDLLLPLPEFTLAADAQEQTAEFVIAMPDGPPAGRMLRAIDLQPGTPAMTRSATVSVRGGATLLAWQPGDEAVALDDAAFVLPAGAELVVTVRYKKTWEYERQAMTDRSTLGLYIAGAARPPVEAVRVTLPGMVLDRSVRLHAIAPDPALTGVDVRLDAIRPDGSRETLIAFRPAAGWVRRYWFEQPVLLPRGTRLGLSASPATGTRPSLLLDVVAAP